MLNGGVGVCFLSLSKRKEKAIPLLPLPVLFLMPCFSASSALIEYTREQRRRNRDVFFPPLQKDDTNQLYNQKEFYFLLHQVSTLQKQRNVLSLE
jgi:hypothetical protein